METAIANVRLSRGAMETTDVVTTVSSAHHNNGWSGGLDTIRNILNAVPKSFSKSLNSLCLEDNLRLSGISGQVLTGHGLELFNVEDRRAAFGGDPRTQVIGLIICALAHECGRDTAYRLFVDCLLPALFEGDNALTDGIAAHLTDETLMTRIINEGASRRLTQRFIKAIQSAGLPMEDAECIGNGLKPTVQGEFRTSEIQFVGGVLKWAVSSSRNTYRTRSGLAARVTICLREVGYPIGQIVSWDGDDTEPQLDQKSVMLVTGGTSSTDPLLLGAEPIPMSESLYVRHYDMKTIGPLFMSAFHHQIDGMHETFQTYFDKTWERIKNDTQIEFEVEPEKRGLVVRPVWKRQSRTHPSPIARRLAALYFPLTADRIAPHYEMIDTEVYLTQVLKHKSICAGEGDFPKELCAFRAITAAVAFSMAFRLMDSESLTRMHSTRLYLGNENWLSAMCKILDQCYLHGAHFSTAVFILAAIHAACNPNDGPPEPKNIIGWRKDTYTVIPSLLMEMAPTPAITSFHCIDIFLVNIKTYGDGTIRDASSVELFRSADVPTSQSEKSSTALQRITDPWVGKPQTGKADAPLYLAFESPRHYNGTDICLAGRIGGKLVGTVSILDVIETVSKSLHEDVSCQGCETTTDVWNVKSSKWARDPRYKPLKRGMATFVPVQDDPAWALFLAGQVKPFDGRIDFTCVNCLIRRLGSKDTVLIGYG